MPPKGKVASRPKEPEAKEAPAPPLPSTVNERSQQRFNQTNPFHKTLQEVGPSGLSPADRNAWASAHLVRAAAAAAAASSSARSSSKLGNKAQRDLWRHVNEASLPLRTLKRRTHPQQQQQQQGLPTTTSTASAPTQWGRDRPGRDVGEYTPEQFDQRAARRVHLTALEIAHRAFLDRRDRARRGAIDPDTGKATEVGEEDVAEEALRRREMAELRADLYGERSDPYARDPAWDDVVPIPQEDPEGALAAIAYPEDYAEAIGYLRAVMVKQECSPRCLKLTEHIISMNPAHYTVWLYRFFIIAALDLSIPDEIRWLNGVALNYLKNYQIWHHRQQLMDQYYPQIRDDPGRVAEVAASETEFLTAMLAEDTKNYHVWSYRQYLVRKLGNWSAAELAATEKLVDDDVRNNSAWSHRFFLVFSDPARATPGSHATERDEAVPREVVDREVAYAQGKIRLAPQNQSPWNYLKGVLAKGGRAASSVQGFVEEFVEEIGEGEDKEIVRSTHALDMLAEIYAEKGESDKAEVCLRRLAEKWDRIRAGYWEYRRAGLSSK